MNWLVSSRSRNLVGASLGVCILTICTFASGTAHAAWTLDKFSFGRLGEARVYKPGQLRHVAMMFSDIDGWSAADESAARALAQHGVLVAGIDLKHYAEQLAKPRDKCSYLAGEFEDFSHELQKQFSHERYHLPLLIGIGRSAGLVYGVAAQGSSGTFLGIETIGFNDRWVPLIRLCQSYGLRYKPAKDGTIVFLPTEQLSTPWIALQREHAAWNVEGMRAFIKTVGTAKASVVKDDAQLRERLVESTEELAQPDQEPKVVADELSDLPLEIVRAKNPTSTMAIFMTGDGGWAEIDKGVSAELSRRGIEVVALNSLQYFWKPRSPDETAKDVARIARHYLTAWRKTKFTVIGYSFGADVAAFAVNRLPSDLRQQLVSVNLLGLAEAADFEVHVTTWLGVDHHGLATHPEVDQLSVPVLCVFGEGEKDTLCPKLTKANVKSIQIGEGHHFGDRYHELSERIISLMEDPIP